MTIDDGLPDRDLFKAVASWDCVYIMPLVIKFLIERDYPTMVSKNMLLDWIKKEQVPERIAPTRLGHCISRSLNRLGFQRHSCRGATFYREGPPCIRLAHSIVKDLRIDKLTIELPATWEKDFVMVVVIPDDDVITCENDRIYCHPVYAIEIRVFNRTILLPEICLGKRVLIVKNEIKPSIPGHYNSYQKKIQGLATTI